MCLLGPLNVLLFYKQIYIYIKVEKLNEDFWLIKFEVRILKSEI